MDYLMHRWRLIDRMLLKFSHVGKEMMLFTILSN